MKNAAGVTMINRKNLDERIFRSVSSFFKKAIK
jgi:hypothetical protein